MDSSEEVEETCSSREMVVTSPEGVVMCSNKVEEEISREEVEMCSSMEAVGTLPEVAVTRSSMVEGVI